jgi:hypothetical protein
MRHRNHVCADRLAANQPARFADDIEYFQGLAVIVVEPAEISSGFR